MADFTFPTIPIEHCNYKPSFPHIASPPPWFIPGGTDTVAGDHRRSFSATELAGRTGDEPGRGHGSERFAVDDEEKMDMLWEDFNEEIACAPPPPCGLGDATVTNNVEMIKKAASGSMVRRKRLSLLMMLKLLKKLFLARKSSAPRKTQPI